tara:strand:- start:75 stop:410 length:336 start_codon:yes stop_codon:yes gene_type:complete
MPLIRVSTSANEIDEDQLVQLLSAEISSLTGKPEKYVMVIVDKVNTILFDRTFEPSAYIEVKAIGSLDSKTISSSLCSILENNTNVKSNRIYLNIQSVEATNWGYDKSVFG